MTAHTFALQVLLTGMIWLPASTGQSCETCHPNESRTQPATPMARAAAQAVEAQILKDHPTMRFAGAGYTYEIRRGADRITYSVSDGSTTFSAPILWAFGFGSIGQTYLYAYRGELYESRVSFYTPLNGLDFTIGHRKIPPSSAQEAAGRLLRKEEVTRCFACHTTEISKETTAGVRCERCHQNAQEHARAFSAQSLPSFTPAKLSELTKDGLSDFCGGCHRTHQEIVSARTFTIDNVRSQPYRLATSKCYRATGDKRISCVACHDPHEDLVKDTSYYDGKCQACHRGVNKAALVKPCPVEKRECIRCHMPKIQFPDGHSEFTDHRIRIVRPGAPFPI